MAKRRLNRPVLIIVLAAVVLLSAGGIVVIWKVMPKDPGPHIARAQELEVKAASLAELVKAGSLPPVDERLPKNPVVLDSLDGIGNFGGVATFPMLCYLEPDFVHELHDLVVTASIQNAVAWLEGVGDYVDVYQCCSDDWGTQYDTFASPEVYRQMFKPYYQRFTSAIHQAAPHVKTFLHSCGAVYDLIDDIVESGFDVLNPVQWPAGGHTYQAWKDKARHRIALWGGGVNSQETLPLGTVEDVEREVADVVSYMKDRKSVV